MLRPAESSFLSAGLLLLAGIIFFIDAFTALDIAIAVMYVVVILLSAQVFRRSGVIAVGVACHLLTIVAYVSSHTIAFSGPALGRLIVSLMALGITVFLTLRGMAHTSALQQRENALRRSQAFLTGTQTISRTGSFSFRSLDGAMYWSQEAARIYGYGPELTPTAELLLARALPEDLHIVRAAIDRTLRAEGPIDVRHRLLMPDGSIRHVHVLSHPSVNSDGQCEYLGALMDVTAAMEAEQALHQSQTQLAHVTRVTTLGELAASIAHEVNQPLAAISANGEAGLRWIERAQPDLDEATAAIRRILEASGRASAVIRRVRSLARKGDPQYVLLDLNEVAEETALLVRRELASHQVSLRLELDATLPAICGDRVQLQQVIINLLMNGMQAMHACLPGQAQLVLQTSAHQADNGEAGVKLSVTDSGPGIAPQHVPQLFEAFFTTKSDGMGMGLPICRSIIEAHGGRIWATGKTTPGALLQFSLPLPTTTA